MKKFSVYVQNRYSFVQNLVAANETPTAGYNLLNAGVVFEFGIKAQRIQLSLSVNNILNETYYDHLSRYKADEIYNIGRSFNVKIVVPLEFKLR